MLVLLLRHGDALLHRFDDAARPLSPLGEHQALIAGKAISRLQIAPQHVVSSPLTRARETTTIVTREIGVPTFDISEYLTPSSDPRQLTHQIKTYNAASILLVGHLPNIQIVASLLTTGSRQSNIVMGTGTLIVLDVPAQLEYGTGSTKFQYSYEQMKRLAMESPGK